MYAIRYDGIEKWKYETSGSIEASVAVSEDGLIFFGSNDHFLYAMDLDGNELWKYETGDKITKTPAIGSDGRVYFSSDDFTFYSVDSSGNENWTFSSGWSIRTPPVVGPDETIYYGGGDHAIYALDHAGNKIWDLLVTGVPGDLAVDEYGNIYFGTDRGKVYAISPDKTKLWEFTSEETYAVFSTSPSITSDGIIIIGDQLFDSGLRPAPSHLLALNQSGEEIWSFLLPDQVYSSPAITEGGIAYVGCMDGKLYAIELFGDILWSFDVCPGSDLLSFPVIDSSGKVYIGSRDGILFAINGYYGLCSNCPWPCYQHDAGHSGNILNTIW